MSLKGYYFNSTPAWELFETKKISTKYEITNDEFNRVFSLKLIYAT